ncbi:sensor histidine kinase [Rhabdothermincola salaria]|uniref:sensor histidine kinase n=1 Tax=Rhabdothermincola salaria TaxID=2903142 RepID=UPI001E60EE79|nr:sensor histidine kinase [Rhabdothermincola salaria]MCD9623742.1 ATP-binding protein [Rhabdothermincola salaria]
MSRSLRRRLTAMMVAVAFLLVIIVVVAAVSLNSLRRAETELIDRVQVARAAAKDLEVALLDQESGVRAFVLSEEGDLLLPTVAGVEAEEAAIEAIQQTTDGDEDVLAALEEVARTMERWREEVAAPVVAAAVDGRPEEAIGLLDAEAARFGEVRVAQNELEALLRQRRDSAVERFDDALTQLVIVGVAGGVLLVAMAVAVTLALRRSVLEPLERLGEDAAIVAGGDFEHEIALAGPEEVRQLGEAIEEMRRRVTQEFFQVLAARADLAAKADELERSNRDLEQFAYVASHDLQEPLRKVAGFCQLLERRYAGTLDERADEYIHYAVDGAQRMQDLISDLLSFSRVGRTTERFELVDLGRVVESVWTHLERPEGAELTVTTELPEVAGDVALLRALFTNLLGNSVKFAGEGNPRVQVSAEADDGFWQIEVADDGIGIDPEFAERIFVIFQRLHGRETFEGTGIGLALCKRIVEFHGGGIRLAESSRGARFVITLPVVEDPAAVGPPPEPAISHRPGGTAP